MCAQAVRDKVVSNLASSLAKAASELKKEGHSQDLPDATAVARAVEQALQKHFGMLSKHVCRPVSVCVAVFVKTTFSVSNRLFHSLSTAYSSCQPWPWLAAADISSLKPAPGMHS